MASKVILFLILSVYFGSFTEASEKIHFKMTPGECYDLIRAATATDRLDLVKLLADQGCSINRPAGSKSREPTPLHIAVVNDNLQMVKALVNDYGAEINALANMADELDNKQAPMCKYLLKDGSSTNVKTSPNSTAYKY